VEDSDDDNCGDQDDADADYIDYRINRRERGQLSKQPGPVMFVDQEEGEPEEPDEEEGDDNAQSESESDDNTDDDELPDLDTSEFVPAAGEPAKKRAEEGGGDPHVHLCGEDAQHEDVLEQVHGPQRSQRSAHQGQV